MKPSDITLDMVRAAMIKTAKWADVHDPARGARMSIETIVLVVHGYDHMPNAPWSERSASKEAATACLSWNDEKLKEPTEAQKKRTQHFLDQLIAAGEVERCGDARVYAWLTPEMLTARATRKNLKERLNEIAGELHELLGGDEAFKAKLMSVSAGLHQYDPNKGNVTLVLDEERARRVLAALKAML